MLRFSRLRHASHPDPGVPLASRRFVLGTLIAVAIPALAACSGGSQSSIPAVSAGGNALPQAAAQAAPAMDASLGTATVPFANAAASADATAPYAKTILADRPNALFELDDASRTVTDAVGGGSTGTYGSLVRHVNTPLVAAQATSAEFVGGAYNEAAFAQIQPSRSLQPARVSVEAWIELERPNATGKFVPIVAYGENRDAGTPYRIELTPENRVNFRISAGAPYYLWHVTSDTTLSIERPHHLVGTFDGAKISLYVDGRLERTLATRGSIVYNDGFNGKDGLAIGGELQDTLANFEGDIADVAVYPAALSAARVEAHYRAGTTAAPAPTSPPGGEPTPVPGGTRENAKPLYDFVNEVGYVAHLNYGDSSYTNDFPQIRALLLGSGAHHIRTSGTGETAHLADLCANGIKHTVEFRVTDRPSDMIDALESYGPACIDAVEPENEYDAYAYNPKHPVTNWVNVLKASLKLIYTTLRSNPRYDAITVLGPGLSSGSRYAMLGDLESISDAGNQHWGTCSGSPDTTHYKNVARSLEYLRASYPTKPIWTLENAYSDDRVDSPVCGLPPSVIAKYIPRTFLERFNFGQPHVYEFEFADIPRNGYFGREGVVDGNARPKPSYLTVKSLLGALGDAPSRSNASPLTYRMTGDTANIHKTLLQAADGTYSLVLWQEVDSWDVDRRVVIDNKPQRVTLVVPSRGTLTARVYSPTPQYTMQQQNVDATGGKIAIDVTDTPSVVSFRP